MNVRVEYERVARACILRQNYNIRQIFTNLIIMNCWYPPDYLRGLWGRFSHFMQFYLSFFRYLVRPVLVEDNKSAALFFTGCVISQLVERTSVKTNQ